MTNSRVPSEWIRDLLDIGFESVGRWHLDQSALKLSLDKWGDIAPALYAFVIGDRVMYVGKTKRTLAHRMYGYLKGSGTQVTNIRVRANLVATLEKEPEVVILGFQGGVPQMVGRFRVSLPAGLEDSIIDELNPPWNGGSSRELQSMPLEPLRLSEDRSFEQTSVEIGTRGVPGGPTDETGVSFTLTIGSAYFHGGFFNVPRRFEHLFAEDGERIAIEDPARNLNISARINRTANQNGTPRIMGGPELRTWMQRHLRLGSDVVVRVLGPQRLQVLLVGSRTTPPDSL